MSNAINDLLQKYARLGWEHWKRVPREIKSQAQSIGVRIATDEGEVQFAATNPYRPNSPKKRSLKLIPMPCKPRNIAAAFFVPWIEGTNTTELSFDLLVLLSQEVPRSMAFRFEPASRDSESTHGYNHIQLSNSLGKQQVTLSNAISPLPTSYPAFPVSATDPTKRFLAMAVAMHGYPFGLPDIIREVFKGEPAKQSKYLEATKSMLGVRAS